MSRPSASVPSKGVDGAVARAEQRWHGHTALRTELHADVTVVNVVF